MTVKRNSTFFLLAFCFFLASFSGSPRLDAQEARLISSVSVSGLKRTKQRVAERPLQKFVGADADRLDFDEVRAAVMDTGVLEPLAVAVTDKEGSCVLEVTVREKWSVFPIPLIIIGSDGMNFGAFFTDTNAFGLLDNFFAGGMYGSREWMAGGGYMHKSQQEGLPGWRSAAFFSRKERHDTDQKEEDIRLFHLDSITASAALSFSLREIWGLSFGLSYGEKILRNPASSLRPPLSDLRTLGFETRVSLRKSNWDGYFLSEESASASYTWHFGIGSPSFHSLRFSLAWEKSIIPGLRFKFHSGGIYSPGAPILQESSPAVARVTILPSSFSAKNYAGASGGLEKYLLRTSFGTLSLLGSWQAVFSRGSILGDQFDQGPAGALSFYMSRLAIPALSVGAAYNIGAGHLQGSFSLGMSF
ncbi:MAG: hypothetical protein LBQ67_04230 [Treponema sp.]|jgi:hypothetical protein|nr:hypothetical protein [Treponema sp.]